MSLTIMATNPLVPAPVEIALGLVVFGILYFAVKKYVVPNFEQTFAERTTAIEGGLKAAETKQAEADAKRDAGQAGDDDVVDADFEEVKDDDKKV